MIKDGEVKDQLVPAIIALANDEAKQDELRRNIAPLAISNADEVVATEVLKSLQR